MTTKCHADVAFGKFKMDHRRCSKAATGERAMWLTDGTNRMEPRPACTAHINAKYAPRVYA